MEEIVLKDGWGRSFKEEEEDGVREVVGVGPGKEWRVEGRATGQNREPLGGA